MRVRPGTLFAALLLACSTAPTTRDTGAPDAAVRDVAASDATLPRAADGMPGAAGWADVDALVQRAVASHRVPGLGLSVYDRADRLVFQKMYGDFASTRRVAIASASKLIAGLLLLDLVDDGRLRLESTTAELLGWKGALGAITLRHLLSFTSGLPPSNLCTARPLITLADCVETISTSQPTAAPGARYDYGSTHLHVAARMAEMATGKAWNQLFTETFAAPLGLPAEVAFYTAPRQGMGTTNPLIAGGMRASMDEYAKLLALVFHKGGPMFRNPTLFDEQAREPFPNATIGISPVRNIGLPYRYGLAAWLECDKPAEGCAVISSPGAFGWTPWVDREVGYYAIIGTELDRMDGGVVDFSVGLAQDLKPLIAAALRAGL